MAGYVKMWTTATDDRAFLSLSCAERGAWFQIIVDSKKQRDNGTVFYRNVTAMGQSLGCKGQTAAKIGSRLELICNWKFQIHPDKTVEITIRNYRWSQEIDSKTMAKHYSKSEPKMEPPRPDHTRPDQTIPYREVIEHLNLLTGKNYRVVSRNTKEKITARWNEGWRLDDFIYVNQVKAEEWLNTEREKYLRPETLYGTKFEGYRNQRRGIGQYSEKTNKALVAAAKYLQKEGFISETERQAPVGEIATETSVGVPKGH